MSFSFGDPTASKRRNHGVNEEIIKLRVEKKSMMLGYSERFRGIPNKIPESIME